MEVEEEVEKNMEVHRQVSVDCDMVFPFKFS